jgi:hypothetical protein
VYIVDFEQQSCAYTAHNRLHLGRMLFTLQCYPIRASAEYLRGISGIFRLLVLYQFRSLKRRIQDRQPALLSVLTTEIRALTGYVFGRALRLFGYD